MIMEVFGKINVETPKFQLLKKASQYEIRKYGKVLTASVDLPTESISGSGGFRYLANYIFGGNEEKQKIAMTAPVVTQPGRMKFILPSEFTAENQLPTPNDPSVKVKAEDEKTVAVLQFTGFVSDSVVDEQELNLKQLLQSDTEWKVVENTNVLLAQYNPPWTLPFMRTNEVMIEVESTTK